MSYDVLVFDPEGAPRDEDAFDEWLDDASENFEGSDLEIPLSLSPNLLSFYNQLRQTFPPMNRPNSEDSDDSEQDLICEYCFGKILIELAFRWGAVERARASVIEAAKSTGVGVYFQSDEIEPAFSKKDLEALRGKL